MGVVPDLLKTTGSQLKPNGEAGHAQSPGRSLHDLLKTSPIHTGWAQLRLSQAQPPPFKLPLNKPEGVQRWSLLLCPRRRRQPRHPSGGHGREVSAPKPRAYAPSYAFLPSRRPQHARSRAACQPVTCWVALPEMIPNDCKTGPKASVAVLSPEPWRTWFLRHGAVQSPFLDGNGGQGRAVAGSVCL